MTNFQNLGPDYKATGKGLGVSLPHSPGTVANSNLLLTNHGVSERSVHRKIWLRCFDVSTQWHLSGSTGQASDSRVFYPHNFSQAPLTLQIAFPNQYERDRFNEFVQVHHKTARLDTGGVVGQGSGAQGGIPLDVKLFAFKIPAGKNNDGSKRYIYIHRPIHVEGYVESAPAGAERFVFAPTLTVSIRVSNDFEQQLSQMPALMNQELQAKYLDYIAPRKIATDASPEPFKATGDAPFDIDKFTEQKAASMASTLGSSLSGFLFDEPAPSRPGR